MVSRVRHWDRRRVDPRLILAALCLAAGTLLGSRNAAGGPADPLCAKQPSFLGHSVSDQLAVVAQNDKDQALLAYVAALRGYWNAHYRLRKLTLYDFEIGSVIR